MKLYFRFLLILALVYGGDDVEHVVPLTTANFDQFIKNNNRVLVEFYAPCKFQIYTLLFFHALLFEGVDIVIHFHFPFFSIQERNLSFAYLFHFWGKRLASEYEDAAGELAKKGQTKLVKSNISLVSFSLVLNVVSFCFLSWCNSRKNTCNQIQSS